MVTVFNPTLSLKPRKDQSPLLRLPMAGARIRRAVGHGVEKRKREEEQRRIQPT